MKKNKPKVPSHKICLNFMQVETLIRFLTTVAEISISEQASQHTIDISKMLKTAAAELVVKLLNRPWREKQLLKVNQVVLSEPQMRIIIAGLHIINFNKEAKTEMLIIKDLVAELRGLLNEKVKSDIIIAQSIIQ